jgi:glutathione S-transferase
VTTTLQEFRNNNAQAKAYNATLPALEVSVDGQPQILFSSLAIAQYLAEVGG